jgi:quinol monooxygenase YgiN
MITRIVKMNFREDEIVSFRLLFDEVKEKIRAQEGCHGVELLQDIANANIFFTISYWTSPAALDNYRNSELFSTVWSKTKLKFAAKAEAWSLV